MSEKPGSTIGFERRFNPLLRIEGDDEFVDELTGDLPPQPPNFERIVELNRGPLLRHRAPSSRSRRRARRGALARGRDAARRARAARVRRRAHPRIAERDDGQGRASARVPPGSSTPRREVIVVAAGEHEARADGADARGRRLPQLRGYLAGGIAAWAASGRPIETTPSIDVPTLAAG